ncbi:MAG: response regulator [bacterium]
MSIKIILADDHNVIIDGIKAVIERIAKNNIEVIETAQNGMEVLDIAENNPPDVYVLDITMPVLNGIDTTKRLMEMDPKSKVIILSMHDDSATVEKAIKSGARGYLLKESSASEIINAVSVVEEGKYYLSPLISKCLVEGYLKRSEVSNLSKKETIPITQRETEIVQLIVEGLNSREIAEKLNLSFKTILRHRNNIMKKLGIHNLAGLIRYAVKEGISPL